MNEYSLNQEAEMFENETNMDNNVFKRDALEKYVECRLG